MKNLAVKTVVTVASGKSIKPRIGSVPTKKLCVAFVCTALTLSFSSSLLAKISSESGGSDELLIVEFNEPGGWADFFAEIKSGCGSPPVVNDFWTGPFAGAPPIASITLKSVTLYDVEKVVTSECEEGIEEYHYKGKIRWRMQMLVGVSIKAFGQSVGLFVTLTQHFDSSFTTGTHHCECNDKEIPGIDANGLDPSYQGPFPIEIEDETGPADSSDDEEEKDDDTNIGSWIELTGISLIWSKDRDRGESGKEGEKENDTNIYREPGTDVPWYGGDSQGVEASESQADASGPAYVGPFEIEDDPGPANSDDEEEKDDDTNIGGKG